MSKPAARVGDMHVCPMQTPAVVPIPHVGGPILPPGAPTVLIGGQPAACVGDMAICVGPPDVIILGSFTVLMAGKPAARMGDMCVHGGVIVGGFPTVMIGDAGGGPGAPLGPNMIPARTVQGATMSAARQQGAAFVEMGCDAPKPPPPPDPKRPHYVEIVVTHPSGAPAPDQRYRVVDSEGHEHVGFVGADGVGRVNGLPPGSCRISFPDLDDRSWTEE